MSAGYLWDEALPELIEELDWSGITPAQWKAISDALDEHVSNSRDFMPPVPSSRDLYEMQERPKREADAKRMAALEAEVQAYNDDIIRTHGGQFTSIQYGRGALMTATDRTRRQSAADHAGREARIEAVTRDLVRMDVPQMIARASYWRGWCIDNEIENTELVRLRYLLDAVAEHLKDERDAEKQKETP